MSAVPTHLRYVRLGPVETLPPLTPHGHAVTGRSVTLTGKGPANLRVEVSDSVRGDCGGNSIDADGKWTVTTVPLPTGNKRILVAHSIHTDGTNRSAPSDPPLVVHIP